MYSISESLSKSHIDLLKTNSTKAVHKTYIFHRDMSSDFNDCYSISSAHRLSKKTLEASFATILKKTGTRTCANMADSCLLQ